MCEMERARTRTYVLTDRRYELTDERTNEQTGKKELCANADSPISGVLLFCVSLFFSFKFIRFFFFRLVMILLLPLFLPTPMEIDKTFNLNGALYFHAFGILLHPICICVVFDYCTHNVHIRTTY